MPRRVRSTVSLLTLSYAPNSMQGTVKLTGTHSGDLGFIFNDIT